MAQCGSQEPNRGDHAEPTPPFRHDRVCKGHRVTAVLQEIVDWLETARMRSQLSIRQVGFKDCNNWRFYSGKFVHKTGKFFSIVGIKTSAADLDYDAKVMPMIDQPEVGWLGFMVRQTEYSIIEWLLQAKTEPGNVFGTQIAPTIQATRSNYMLEHNGKPTRFFEDFNSGSTFVSDAPHSEQGTKFLWKFNRNSVLALPKTRASDELEDENWKWCGGSVLRTCLGLSYTINTDARSVISSSPWALLAEGKPLFNSPVLAASYKKPTTQFPAIKRRVGRVGLPASIGCDFVNLGDMPGWTMTNEGIFDGDHNEVVSCFEVKTKDREVDVWHQPFLGQSTTGDFILLMRVVEGIAQFFIRIHKEYGFGDRLEFGPSIQKELAVPKLLLELADLGNAHTIIKLDQSDEGGRFMQVMAEYRVVLVSDQSNREVYPFGQWVHLSILEQITKHAGTSTNELRTLTSLLLSTSFDEACVEFG